MIKHIKNICNDLYEKKKAKKRNVFLPIILLNDH